MLLRCVGQRAPASGIRLPADIARAGPRQRLLVVLGGLIQHLRRGRLVQPGHDPQQQRQAIGGGQLAQVRQRQGPAAAGGGHDLAQRRDSREQFPEVQRPVGHRQGRRMAAERAHRRGQRRRAALDAAALQLGQHRGTAFDAAQEGGQGGGCGRAVGGGRGGHRNSIIGAMIARPPPRRALDNGAPIGCFRRQPGRSRRRVVHKPRQVRPASPVKPPQNHVAAMFHG